MRLVGETYVYRAGNKRVVVLDHELTLGVGRTGRLIVTPVGELAGRPFVVRPEELDPA